MGETVLVDQAVDLVGIVLDEGTEDILDAFFQDPERIDSREKFLVVCVLLYELGVRRADFFVVYERVPNTGRIINNEPRRDYNYDQENLEQREPLGIPMLIWACGRMPC